MLYVYVALGAACVGVCIAFTLKPTPVTITCVLYTPTWKAVTVSHAAVTS